MKSPFGEWVGARLGERLGDIFSVRLGEGV